MEKRMKKSQGRFYDLNILRQVLLFQKKSKNFNAETGYDQLIT